MEGVWDSAGCRRIHIPVTLLLYHTCSLVGHMVKGVPLGVIVLVCFYMVECALENEFVAMYGYYF